MGDTLSTLVAAVVAGEVAETLSSPGNFTVFAPNDAAFAALPAGTPESLLKPENKHQPVDILTYHVLPSQALSTDLTFFQRVDTVKGKSLHVLSVPLGGDAKLVKVGSSVEATVIGADNLASNGVVHIMDSVMLPPADVLEVDDEPTKNIVELAQSVDTLSTLLAAVVAGELAETLSARGNFTVFAPNDAAFAALPTGTLESLLKPENKDQLVDILTYHVLPSQVLSTDLKFFQRVDTVEGKELHVASVPLGGGAKLVKVGSKLEATVIGAENLASNGVVHIIDTVMLPPADDLEVQEPTDVLQVQDEPTKNIVELAQSVDTLSTLVAAVVAGELAETLSSPGNFTVFAPNDAAFAALPAGTLESLLKPVNKDQLVDILPYHVLPSQVLSTDLKFS